MKTAPVTIETDHEAENKRLKAELAEAADELDILRAMVPELNHDSAVYRMYFKIQRQRAALNAMNLRHRRLRFALQLHNRLRAPVTAEEWMEARAAIEGEREQERLGKEVPAAA